MHAYWSLIIYFWYCDIKSRVSGMSNSKQWQILGSKKLGGAKVQTPNLLLKIVLLTNEPYIFIVNVDNISVL